MEYYTYDMVVNVRYCIVAWCICTVLSYDLVEMCDNALCSGLYVGYCLMT